MYISRILMLYYSSVALECFIRRREVMSANKHERAAIKRAEAGVSPPYPLLPPPVASKPRRRAIKLLPCPIPDSIAPDDQAW